MKKMIPTYSLRILFFLSVILLSAQVFAITHTITITSSSTYSPSSLIITDGDLVVFQLGVGASSFHPTAADNGTDWTTFTLANPGDQSSAFTLSVGTHGYHCNNHGGVGTGMHGTITVTTVAGTKGKASAYGLTVTPNPFADEVTLNIDPSHSELTSIRITDLIGNEVATIDLSNRTSSYSKDLSHLKPGVYFCNLYSDKGILETRKLFRTK